MSCRPGKGLQGTARGLYRTGKIATSLALAVSVPLKQERSVRRHVGKFGKQREKETDMTDLYPVANPRPWGASLTISSAVIIVYLALTLFIA